MASKVSAPWYLLDKDTGFLKSRGRYRTKIKPEDLPDRYLKIYQSGETKFIDVASIKRIYYKGNYAFDHYFKDDILLLFWNRSSTETFECKCSDDLYRMIDEASLVVSGSEILQIIKSVKEQDIKIDMSPIIEEIHRKIRWLHSYYRNSFSRSMEDNLNSIIDKIGPDPRESEYKSMDLLRYESKSSTPENPADDFLRFAVVACIESKPIILV